MPSIRTARFAELDAATLYALLRLRVDVFVVEQECPYPELDGRDLEPATVHLWAEEDGAVTGCLRLLRDDDGWRIGRVCTAAAARGTGVADALMRAALAVAGDARTVLDAQTYAAGFYGRHGFTVSGAEYLEDGIPHVPMTRAGRAPRSAG